MKNLGPDLSENAIETGISAENQTETATNQTEDGTTPTEDKIPQNEPAADQTQGGIPQNESATDQTQGGIPQSEPAADQTQGGIPQSEPAADQTQGGIPQSEPAADQTQGGIPQSEPAADQTQGEANKEPPQENRGPSEEGSLLLDIIVEAKNSDGTEKTEYYVGEEILSNARIGIGQGTSFENLKLKITIPKAYLTGKPRISKSEFASSISSEEDDKNYYTTMDFPKLDGGTNIGLPVFMKHKNGSYATTPQDFQTPIKIEMFDSEGILLKEATKIFTAKVNPLHMYAYMYSYSLWRGEYEQIYTGGYSHASRHEIR